MNQLQEAYELNRREQKRIAELRRVDENSDLSADPLPSQQPRSSSADQDNAERKDGKEVFDEQRYAADLAAAAKEQRAAAKRIREMHGAPVAFEVRLDAGEEASSAAPSYQAQVDDYRMRRDDSEPSHIGLRSNSEADEYTRGLRVVTEAMQGRSRQASREERRSELSEVVERRRRSWGAPVDLNDIRRGNPPQREDPDANGEMYRGDIVLGTNS